jgi:hypothetical protein
MDAHRGVEMELLQHGQFRWGAPCSSSFGNGTLRLGEGMDAMAMLRTRGCFPPLQGPAMEIQSTQPPLPLNLSHEGQLLLALARGWRLVPCPGLSFGGP